VVVFLAFRYVALALALGVVALALRAVALALRALGVVALLTSLRLSNHHHHPGLFQT